MRSSDSTPGPSGDCIEHGGRAVPDYGAPSLSIPIPLRPAFAVGCRVDMTNLPKHLPCDGCGLPASPEHIAQRVGRLELATQFRPVHIGVLFIVLAPPASEQDDFYGATASKEFADPFLNALNIPAPAPAPANAAAPESGALVA